VLPVYNAGNFLQEAVKSILDQTYTDFELIIINDCSTDNSAAILDRFNDPRIRLFSNDTNLKVVKTLNKGISLARGKYIARMDADDISHPKRFEKQVAFLEQHSEIDLCGTWVQTFGSESNVMRAATEHEHIKVRLFFVNPMFHPAVMFKKDSFEKFGLTYDEHYTNAEDYGLWVKAIDALKFANLPEVLLKYRIHDTNVSVFKESNKKILDEIHYSIYTRFLKQLKVDFNDQELLMQRKLGMVNVGKLELNELEEYLLWLKKLTVANNADGYFDAGYFRDVIFSYILYLVKQTTTPVQAAKMAYKILGNFYNLSDAAGFFISRTKVKLQPVEKF
jgi:glycosyltransferase involved in cell wall biosynthesis